MPCLVSCSPDLTLDLKGDNSVIGIIIGVLAGTAFGWWAGHTLSYAELKTKLADIKSGISKFEVTAETDVAKVLADLKKRL